MLLVVALGGNAFLQKGETPSVSKEFSRARIIGARLARLAARHRIVITHGNGPQVGNILLRNDRKGYAIPLDVAVAQTQGELGYAIGQSLGLKRAAAVLTHVLVDRRDPAFRKRTKPIGPYYHERRPGTEKINGGYRKVVPSPRPLRILEEEAIGALVSKGFVVIAAGGGGIPVIKRNGRLEGVDAVIDKDYASACLAKVLRADMLLILTDVPCAYLDYGTKDQTAVGSMTVAEARTYIKKGHFAVGSMLPKVEAAVEFVAACGKKAIITDFSSLEQALQGETGTMVSR